VAALLFLLFAVPTRERVAILLNNKAALAYLHFWRSADIDGARRFMDPVLRGDVTADVRRTQEKVAPGETVLVWTELPFLLDYRRNRVIDMNVAGLNQAWARIPPSRYVIWQYSGYGIVGPREYESRILTVGRRTGEMSARALDVVRWFQRILPYSNKLSNEGGVLVLQPREGTPPPPG
jgi:hypothetical protein